MEIESSEKVRGDMKIWRKEFEGKQLRVGWGGLGLLLLILRTCLAILERLEAK